MKPFFLLKSFRRRFYAVLTGVALAFVLCEAGLRLGSAVLYRLEHRFVPEKAGAKQNEFRILCLGESTTARGGEDSWPAQLGAVLNEKSAVGPRFTVINGGREGINTALLLADLDQMLDRYRPHVVITMIGINDVATYVPAQDADSPRFWNRLKTVQMFKLLAARVGQRFFAGREEAPTESAAQAAYFDPDEVTQGTQLRLPDDIRSETLRLHNEAEALRLVGRNEEAAALFEKVLAADPRIEPAVVGLCEIRLNQGRYDAVEARLREYLRLNPYSEHAYAQLLLCLRNLKKFDEGRLVFEDAMRYLPGSRQVCVQYFSLVSDIRMAFEEKEKILLDLLGRCPESPMLHVCAGIFYHTDLKRPDRAEAMLLRAIALGSRDSRPYLYLVDVYQKQGKSGELDRHMGVMRAFIEKELRTPTPSLYRYNFERLGYCLGLYYLQQGRGRESRECFELAEALRSRCWRPMTVENYGKIRDLVLSRGVRLVCMQYPLRSVALLEKIVGGRPGVSFVDNGPSFREALTRERYEEYFTDHFAGDFGHATRKGNRLIAENAARGVLAAVGL